MRRTTGPRSSSRGAPNPAARPAGPISAFPSWRYSWFSLRLGEGYLRRDLGDFDVHQRHELLTAMKIAVGQIALGQWTRNAELEGPRIVALKESHLFLAAAKQLRKPSRR